MATGPLAHDLAGSVRGLDGDPHPGRVGDDDAAPRVLLARRNVHGVVLALHLHRLHLPTAEAEYPVGDVDHVPAFEVGDLGTVGALAALDVGRVEFALEEGLLTAGSHNITASFGGAGEHLASNSATYVQSVNLGAGTATTTTVTSSANPSFGGLPVTFTATVSGSSGTPTGTVTFYWSCPYTCGTGLVPFATVALSGGTATTTQTLTTYGGNQSSYSIQAIYNGDASNQVSTSSALSQSVQRAPTTTTVSSSLNPSSVGQSVTLTATVTSSGGASSFSGGTVTFFDGSTSLGTVGLPSNGVASLSSSSLSTGAHYITATFNADLEHTGSTSAALVQAVNQGTGPSTTSLVSLTNPSAYNQNVTLTATVTGSSGTPTGSVTFADGASVLGTISLSGGTASYSTSSLTIGNHNIQASYNGSTTYAVSTGSLVQTVTAPTVAVTTASLPGGTFNVGYTAPALTASGGTSPYTFAATGLPSGLTLNSSTGVISGTPTQSGNFTVNVTATDSTSAGNGGPFTSATKSLSLAIGKQTTTTVVSASAATGMVGQTITLTATVAPSAAGGTVTFTDGATPICSNVAVASGIATCSVTFTAGPHTIVATSSGSTNYAGSASAPITITITDQRVKTVEAIGKFLNARNNQILSNEPEISRQVDRLNEFAGGGASDGSVSQEALRARS